ncbi:hypothetical protein [Pseudarthrobacter sp. N5]|uniref:hypothetical protein n=1 Tax=Pseudarthrobacter sp. N5 TaxID=3418416 RepID=UPI003CF0B3F6
MAEDKKDAAAPSSYELIGPGVIIDFPDGDDDGGPPPEGPVAVVLRLAVQDARVALGRARFWVISTIAILASWLVAVPVVLLMSGGGYPPEVQGWGYLLTSACLTLTASLLATHWGLSRLRTGPGQDSGTVDHARSSGPLRPWIAAMGRGLVFTAVATAVLLVLAVSSGGPVAIAGVAAVVMLLEFVVFSAIGAGAESWSERRPAAVVTGWLVGLILAVGNVAAAIALLPAVRADEPVSVALNVQRDYGSERLVSYECAGEIVGAAEVFHTERIIWLAAANPVVIFGLLAGQAVEGENSIAWLPGELQAAAEGPSRQVACVNAEEMAEPATELPLSFSGPALQLAVAGVFLAAGGRAARRRQQAAVS